MIPRIPFLFEVGFKVDPFRLISNFERMYKDLKYSRDRNIVKSSFVVDFCAISNLTNVEQRKYYFNPPKDCVITNIEIEAYSSGSAATVSLSATGINTVETTVTSTSGNRGYKSLAQNLKVTTSGITFTVASTAAIASVKMTVTIQSQRLAKRTFTSKLVRIAAGTTLASLVSTLNTAFTDYETETTENTTSDNDLRVEVITMRDDTASPLLRRTTYLSSKLRNIAKVDISMCLAATDKLNITVYDESFSAIDTALLAGNGATTVSQVTFCQDKTQTVDDPQDNNDDWILEFIRNTGTATVNWLTATIYYY